MKGFCCLLYHHLYTVSLGSSCLHGRFQHSDMNQHEKPLCFNEISCRRITKKKQKESKKVDVCSPLSLINEHMNRPIYQSVDG